MVNFRLTARTNACCCCCAVAPTFVDVDERAADDAAAAADEADRNLLLLLLPAKKPRPSRAALSKVISPSERTNARPMTTLITILEVEEKEGLSVGQNSRAPVSDTMFKIKF